MKKICFIFCLLSPPRPQLRPLRWAVCTMLMALAWGPAHSCDLLPEDSDWSVWSLKKSNNAVVFEAKVVSLVVAPSDPLRPNRPVTAVLAASKWWLGGRPQTKVNLSAEVGTAVGTSCAGMNDFNAKLGQNWLIVGQEISGVVKPNMRLSRPLDAQGLSPQETKALAKPS